MRRTLLFILLLAAFGSAAAQQHAKKPAALKPEDTGPVSVTRSATLQVPIASDAVTVFSYLSDQQKLMTWFPEQAILEPQFGGKYHFRWKDQEPLDGVVTGYLAANMLAYTWKHPSDVVETQVRFKLSPQGGQTMVDLEHSGFASADDLDKAVKFWVFYLQNLRSVIEEQTDLRQVKAKTTTPPARVVPRSHKQG
jgi:uncharacterized protein YndB with AHSA1/START domain